MLTFVRLLLLFLLSQIKFSISKLLIVPILWIPTTVYSQSLEVTALLVRIEEELEVELSLAGKWAVASVWRVCCLSESASGSMMMHVGRRLLFTNERNPIAAETGQRQTTKNANCG